MAQTLLFGKPQPSLPPWAEGGSGGSLSQRFLDRYGAKPKMAGGGWLGDLGPGSSDTMLSGVSEGVNPSIPNWQQPGAVKPFNLNPPNVSGVGSAVGTGISDATSSHSGINWGALAKGGKDLAPYISNIANAFRKPPLPDQPGMEGAISLSTIDNSNERANINNATHAQDMGADRGLDGNAAASFKAANLATKLHAFGDSYARENTANVGIRNEQAQFNAGVSSRNLQRQDNYNDKLVEAKLAQQRNSSANLANASDKFIAIDNAKEERALKEREFTEASRLFNPGVAERYAAYNKNPGAFWAQQQQDEADREAEERRLNAVSRQTPKGGTASSPSMKFGGKMRVSSMRKVYK